MNQLLTIPTKKISISPLGLETTAKLTLNEWKAIAPALATSARSLAFIIGDWFNYSDCFIGGDSGQDPLDIAVTATGLDVSTLNDYAIVARRVPIGVRSDRLSWEHHKILARLPERDQEDWIRTCLAEEDAGRHMTLRRLRKSINLGRVATIADLEPDESDQGIENHMTYVNRLSVWWRHMKEDGFLTHATPAQRWALQIDLLPIVQIYNALNTPDHDPARR